jgi:DNA-binding transcriptional MerR regulator
LQTVLLFRELEFPLQEIKRILDAPDFDAAEAIEDQIKLLELRRQHLDDLLKHARQIQKTGVIPMNFKPFDTTEIENYTAETKTKWGKTGAYKEFEQKTAGQSREQQEADGNGLMAIFARMGTIRTADPSSPDAQALVKELQDFITAHYYTCTKQILQGLGMMYIAGDEMTANIDKAGGEGTAQFAYEAITIYCK